MWVTIQASSVLYVDRGRDVIVCDRGYARELVVQLSPAALDALRKQIGHGPRVNQLSALALPASGLTSHTHTSTIIHSRKERGIARAGVL